MQASGILRPFPFTRSVCTSSVEIALSLYSTLNLQPLSTSHTNIKANLLFLRAKTMVSTPLPPPTTGSGVLYNYPTTTSLPSLRAAPIAHFASLPNDGIGNDSLKSKFTSNNNDNDATQDDEEAPTETNDRENKPRRPSDTTNNNGPPTQPPGQRPAILWRPIPAASSPTNDNDESPTTTNSGESVPWAPQIGTTTEPPSKRPSNAPTKVSRYYSLIEIYHSCRHSSFPLYFLCLCICIVFFSQKPSYSPTKVSLNTIFTETGHTCCIP